MAEIWILLKRNKFCFGNIIIMILMITIMTICSGAVRLISPVFCIFKDINFKENIMRLSRAAMPSSGILLGFLSEIFEYYVSVFTASNNTIQENCIRDFRLQFYIPCIFCLNLNVNRMPYYINKT